MSRENTATPEHPVRDRVAGVEHAQDPMQRTLGGERFVEPTLDDLRKIVDSKYAPQATASQPTTERQMHQEQQAEQAPQLGHAEIAKRLSTNLGELRRVMLEAMAGQAG